MPSAERTVTIDRPIETVFAFFADAENEAKWRPAIKSIKRIGDETGPGAHYEQQMSGPGGRTIPADFEITSFEPNSLMGFKTTKGPVRPEGEFRFRQAGDGTEVTFAIEATLSGLKKLFMSSQVRKVIDGEVASLDKAKQVVEQEDGQGVEPNTGQAVEPDAGQTFEPNQGQTFEPDAGQAFEPNEGQTFEQNEGQTFEQEAGETGEPHD